MADRDPVRVRISEPLPLPVKIEGSTPNAAPPNPNQMPLPTVANSPPWGTGGGRGSGSGGYHGFFGHIAKWVDQQNEWQKANRELMIGVGKFASILVAGSHTVAEAISLWAFNIAKESQKASLRIAGQQQEADVVDLEQRKENTGKGLKWGGQAAGAAIGARFGLPGAIAGGIIGRLVGEGAAAVSDSIFDKMIAREKEFIIRRDALRGRTESLRGYDERIGKTFAIGQMNQVRRDMGEAAIIGGRLAEVESRQQQLDLINQQISILNRIEETDKQNATLTEKLVEQQKKLDDKLKNVDKNTADMVRKLQELAKTPLEGLEEAGGFKFPGNADIGMEREREQLRRASEGFLDRKSVV